MISMHELPVAPGRLYAFGHHLAFEKMRSYTDDVPPDAWETLMIARGLLEIAWKPGTFLKQARPQRETVRRMFDMRGMVYDDLEILMPTGILLIDVSLSATRATIGGVPETFEFMRDQRKLGPWIAEIKRRIPKDFISKLQRITATNEPCYLYGFADYAIEAVLAMEVAERQAGKKTASGEFRLLEAIQAIRNTLEILWLPAVFLTAGRPWRRHVDATLQSFNLAGHIPGDISTDRLAQQVLVMSDYIMSLDYPDEIEMYLSEFEERLLLEAWLAETLRSLSYR
jgi:hypothetical protein